MECQIESTNFYKNAEKYWSEISPTLDGMLGGFGYISDIDIRGSKALLNQLFKSDCPPGRGYALDCGAGIGRVTKYLLSELFDKVDLVEQNEIFLRTAKTYIGEKKMNTKIGELFPVGLQNFQPEPGKYDVIWIQWVLSHLNDRDLIEFLKLCQKSLKPNGMIIAKENITSGNQIEIDQIDYSVTRPVEVFKELFIKADLECCIIMKQKNLPKGLYQVYMFALKPKQQDNTNEMN